MDATDPKDLIDFWNLRATHSYVLPVPKQWLPEISDYCKNLILKNYRPLPGNPYGVMINSNVMFARSFSDADIETTYATYLRTGTPGANTLQTWYPPIWREGPELVVRRTRPKLTAKKESIETQYEESKATVRFKTLAPEWSTKYAGKYRWANVVRFRSYAEKSKLATIFPCSYKSGEFPRLGFASNGMVSNKEGLVCFPRWLEDSEYWELTNGQESFLKWFKLRKIDVQVSPAGRSAQQIIETLQGFWGVGKIASKGIIELLDEMVRKPITHSMKQQEFRNKVDVATRGMLFRERTYETLVERNVVQLGMEINCPKCSSWNWYTVKELDYECRCNNCLKNFSFPNKSPSDNNLARWSYRVVGPFAWPNYAQGGYSAALSIRFFASVIGRTDSAEVSWSSGLELEFDDKKKSEADFILWYQRKSEFSGLDHSTETVFGEAKSFGRDAFTPDDISRLKLLAEKFPGSVLVFSTLRKASELSEEEIQRLATLAEWGREFDKKIQKTRAPVIILTGLELFTEHHLEESWKGEGGRHAQYANASWLRLENLRYLADITQQLYLGMRPYGEALRERIEAKRLKAKKKIKKKKVPKKAKKPVRSRKRA